MEQGSAKGLIREKWLWATLSSQAARVYEIRLCTHRERLEESIVSVVSC
jgi:hypothetical protein